jgi:hypothetical protein
MFLPGVFIPGPRLRTSLERSGPRKISWSPEFVIWWCNIQSESTGSARQILQISPSGTDRVAFTAARRLWPKRPWQGSATDIFGDCESRSKVQRYAKVYDNVNSISHRRDFAKASLDLWEGRAPFGTYNITNPGWVTTRQVVERIKARLKLHRDFEYFENDTDFYKSAAQTPRSNCVLDGSKLAAAGVSMRPVEEALEASLAHWTPERR